MMEIEIARHNHLVDPALHVWGWQVAAYLFLGGVTAGIMIVSALLARHVAPDRQSRAMRLMIFAAPIALSIGMFALFLDLENKLHVWRFYTAFRVTSPMSWGSWILLLIYPATMLLGLVRLTAEEIGRLPMVVRRITYATQAFLRPIETVNVLLGIALGAYTGILLSTLGARELWSSALLGPLFLVSGLSTGAALAMLLPVTPEEHDIVRRWDLWAIALELVLLALFFVGLGTSAAGSRAAAALFVGGPYTAAFWSIIVIAGLGVPATLELFETRVRKSSLITPALLLAGGFALRWIFVAAGQSSF